MTSFDKSWIWSYIYICEPPQAAGNFLCRKFWAAFPEESLQSQCSVVLTMKAICIGVGNLFTCWFCCDKDFYQDSQEVSSTCHWFLVVKWSFMLEQKRIHRPWLLLYLNERLCVNSKDGLAQKGAISTSLAWTPASPVGMTTCNEIDIITQLDRQDR